ncbi:MFS transporter [Actinomadura sp. K4S16]|uniref:MFS transporter n=1 Tax=Actinomadura sp. K4S16 TaxID=1316147 RepID=UPI0011ECD9E8|nr:MFS transporter [Actinomadura sp. K4S16]
MSSQTTAEQRRSPERRQHRPGLGLALLAFAQLIISIDYNIVFVALPQIGDALGFTSQSLQWVVSAYAVLFGGCLLFGGRASDILGRRRMFVAGLGVYAVTSAVAGLATTAETLVIARGAQGLGGALLFPATLSLVNTMFAEGRERNRALAVWSGSGAGGLVLGSLLGGLLTEAFGWESVFFVNVPLAAAAIALAFLLIPSDAPRRGGRRFDLPGAVTATGGATLLVFVLVQAPEAGWTSGPLLAAAGSLALLASFVLIETRTRDPLMPLRLLRNRGMAAGVTITFLFTSTFGSMLYFLTIYFQEARGYGALETGTAFLLPMGIVLCGNALAGKLLTRLGMRTTLIVGMATVAFGTVLLGLAIAPDTGYITLIPGLAVFAVGGGVTFTSMFAAATSGVPGEQQGIASGIASTGQQVGSAVGLAVLVAIANASHAADQAVEAAVAAGVRNAAFAAAAGMAAMLLVALTLKPAPRTG